MQASQFDQNFENFNFNVDRKRKVAEIDPMDVEPKRNREDEEYLFEIELDEIVEDGFHSNNFETQLIEYRHRKDHEFKNTSENESIVEVVDYEETNALLRQLHFEKISRTFANMLFL